MLHSPRSVIEEDHCSRSVDVLSLPHCSHLRAKSFSFPLIVLYSPKHRISAVKEEQWSFSLDSAI